MALTCHVHSLLDKLLWFNMSDSSTFPFLYTVFYPMMALLGDSLELLTRRRSRRMARVSTDLPGEGDLESEGH